MTKLTTLLLLALALFGGSPRSLVAVEYDQAVLPLLTRPFFYGRDYFVLGSGRTKMIVQADKDRSRPRVPLPAVRRRRLSAEQGQRPGTQFRRRSRHG